MLEEVDGEDLHGAFRRYEAHRKPRTSRIQAISSANTWMKGGDEDTSWLYGYDAWNVPLTPWNHTSKLFKSNRNAAHRTGRNFKRLTAAPSRFDCVRRGTRTRHESS